jgi:hypothetical protein
MRITYAWHATRQMAERVITKADVSQCLAQWDSRYETRVKTQYKGVVGGRVLKVGVAPDRDTDEAKHVTTAMWEDEDDV